MILDYHQVVNQRKKVYKISPVLFILLFIVEANWIVNSVVGVYLYSTKQTVPTTIDYFYMYVAGLLGLWVYLDDSKYKLLKWAHTTLFIINILFTIYLAYENY